MYDIYAYIGMVLGVNGAAYMAVPDRSCLGLVEHVFCDSYSVDSSHYLITWHSEPWNIGVLTCKLEVHSIHCP